MVCVYYLLDDVAVTVMKTYLDDAFLAVTPLASCVMWGWLLVLVYQKFRLTAKYQITHSLLTSDMVEWGSSNMLHVISSFSHNWMNSIIVLKQNSTTEEKHWKMCQCLAHLHISTQLLSIALYKCRLFTIYHDQSHSDHTFFIRMFDMNVTWSSWTFEKIFVMQSECMLYLYTLRQPVWLNVMSYHI